MYYLIQLFSHSCRAERRLVKTAPPTAHKGRLLLTLLFMLLTAATAWADNVTLTSSTKTWKNNNTYVTNGDVTIADRITVTGNVTLILTDGYTLSAPNGIEVRYPNSLTIEGGTNGTGTLTIEKNGNSKAGIGGGSGKYTKDPVIYGNITINGGIVNVKGGAYGAGIGGNNNSSITGCGTITINGGIVNATGGTGAAGIGGGNCSNNDGAKGGCGDIVINGGQVTATGGYDGPGIGPGKGAADITSGSLVLGWTNTSDFIQVTGVKSNVIAYGFSNRLGSISFADGKKFNIVDGGEATTENIKNRESLTLIPKGSEQYQLSVATISGISASYDLTGSSLDIPFSVSDAEGNTLTLGTDYTATLGTTSQESTTIHITEGGKYTLTITGMGSYSGSKSVDFEVVSIGFKKDANGDDYINMPKTGIYDATIPSGVSSFKVYDDGGAKAKYSDSCDGGLVLIAPANHVLQLTGTVTAEVQVNNPLDYLMVYDGGSTSAQKIGDKYGSESEENIGTLISSGTQMTLTFHSDVSGQRDGLDLTATLKRDLGSCVIANIDAQPYTGSAIKPDLVITYEGTALVKDVDYEVTYSNNTLVGTATITITGKGNYAKTTSKTFNIVKATPNVSAPAAVDNLIYSGKNQDLVVAGTTDFGTLLYSTDGNNYSEGIPTATNAGTYTVYYKVEGSDNWNAVDAASVEATISPKAVTNDDITITIPSQVWTDSELTPVITVKDGETVLTENTDYTVTSPTGTIQDAGDYTYTITGKGNYSGETTAKFTVVPKKIEYQDVNGVTITEDQTGITALLDGTSVVQVDIPTSANIVVDHVTYNRTFTQGKLSTVMLPFSKAVSEISGGTFYTFGGMKKESDKWVATMNEVTGSIEPNTPYLVMPTGTSLTFSGGATLNTTCDGQTAEYDGFELRGTYAGKTWVESDPEIGKAHVYNNIGELIPVTAGTTILPMECYIIQTKTLMTDANINISTPSKVWTGSELTPVITVKDGETVLTENTDYTVTAPSGTIQDVGDYTYTITGAGNYSGETTVTFTIARKGVTVMAEDKTKEYGAADPELTATVAGLVGEDKITYTLSRAEGENAGEYAITASGEAEQGNYSVTYAGAKFTITAANGAVTAPTAITGLEYNGKAQNLIAAGSSATGTIQYSLDGNTYAESIPQGTDAKEYTIYYKVVADANHKDVAAATVKVTIARKAATVTADDKTKEYGAADPELTATVAGLVGEDKITYTLSRAEGENAGEYAITASGEATQGNYSVTFVAGKLTINAKPEPETPEPNTEVVNPDETVTVGGETFYEPKEETKEALKEHFDTDFALSAEAANSMTLNSNGEMEFKQGKNVDVAIANKQKGDVMKFEFTGKMFGDSSKLRQKGVASTRSAGDMELISGAEYEVLETGSIVITVAAQEAPVTFKGISTTAAGATGIEAVNKKPQAADSWYDLNGRKVEKPTQKGIYIRNGQKVVIK